MKCKLCKIKCDLCLCLGLPFAMDLFHKLGNCFPYNGTGANSNLLKAMYIQQEATKLFYFYVEVVRLMEFTYPGKNLNIDQSFKTIWDRLALNK